MARFFCRSAVHAQSIAKPTLSKREREPSTTFEQVTSHDRGLPSGCAVPAAADSLPGPLLERGSSPST
eukprot:scaffold1399_cov410-Prasinococcus_capsulatus_cf.AAC.3